VTERAVEHSSFTIVRRYAQPPRAVFAAWANADRKSRWFRGPEDWAVIAYELDFRVGGRELNSGGPAGGPVHTYRAHYWDIVPDERIVYTYEMLLDETRISISLTTIELRADGNGTRLTLTEHGAFLDGLDSAAGREQGSGALLDALAGAL
jgi:uncharacterized protein YndB with AHSA1/START domain